MTLIEQIRKIVLPIRKQLEDTLADTIPFESERLCAIGQCDLYAPIVTDSLCKNKFEAETVSGCFDGCFHFWTECAGLIVDVTVDQFGAYLPQVLIGTYQEFPQYKKFCAKSKLSELKNKFCARESVQ